jgi:hypothetical protein
MTMTIFVLVGRAAKAEVSSMTGCANEDQCEDLDIKVEHITIKDPEAQIPVLEASDDGDEEEDWTERDEGPDHYGWEEVYELNDCSPEYL